MTCPKCRHDHPDCAAHNAQGLPCRRRPVIGATVCYTHGGATRQVKAKAARRLAQADAERRAALVLAEAFGDKVPDVHPAEAILLAVAQKAFEVQWLRGVVAQLEEDALVWGVTKDKTGGDDAGTTYEARPNVWWTMLRTAEDQLVKFAKAALDAGVDERMVRLAEAQATRIDQVLEAALRALGHDYRSPEVAAAVRQAIASTGGGTR